MNEEEAGLWVRQREHTRGHLWHRYYVVFYQGMRIDDLSFITRNHRFVASLLVAILDQGNQDMNHKLYNINWDIYFPWTGAAGMLLNILLLCVGPGLKQT